MTLTDKQKNWINNAPNFDEDMIKRLQNPEFESGWIELALQEFLEEGNFNTFIRCLTYVVKARGHGEISRLAQASSIDRGNLSEILSGKVTPRIDTALKLIRGLGYEYDIKLKTA